jgi:biotin carboxylase
MASKGLRTLAVLGAGADQAFLIRTAREMGLRTLAFDMNPDAPGFQHADDYAAISTRDVPGLCGFLDTYAEPVAGVITMGSDIPEVVAAVATHLDLPGISAETARISTDKFAMKQRFREMGIPIPWFSEISSGAELEQIFAERGSGLVIKPVDRSGARGVFVLSGDSDLGDLFEKAREFSYSDRVMVEEYLPGPQISTETLMYQGQGTTPGFVDRNYEHLGRFAPHVIENGGWLPSHLDAAARAEVEQLVEAASLALGVTDGVTKGDVVITPDGPKMIEMAARLSGGDFSESLVPLGTGVNYVRTAIQIALGDVPDMAALVPTHQQAVANPYFFPEAGELLSIEGVDEVRSKNWVKKLEFWYQPGDQVPEPISHAHRFGVFVVVAPDRAELEKRVSWVYETIKIEIRP